MKHSKKILIVILFIVILLITTFVIFDKKKEVKIQNVQNLSNPVSVPSNTISENIGGKNFFLEIASNETSRELGLGQRNSLAESGGMIFIFQKLDKYGFWMKDTHFPLDIIWLNDKCVVVGKATMQPESLPKVFLPDFPAMYAIELPLGATTNVKESDTLSCADISKIQSL